MKEAGIKFGISAWLRRERKEGERQQLADLVGKNLTYISQLEGLDFKLYQVHSSFTHSCRFNLSLVSHERSLGHAQSK